jgi:alkylhydroperoxidase/carboxymuconolactone decarboxylase family protein YurZ
MNDAESPEVTRLLQKLVPPPYRPPLLYREIARNEAVARCFAEGPIAGPRGLLHTGQLDPGERELCILRVTAKKYARHEWGVHVAYFGRSSGLTASQIDATATGAVPQPAWTARQRAILAITDAVAECRALTDDERGAVNTCLTAAERTEFTVLASLYLAIAAMCSVLEVPVEPGTPEMPS